MADENDRPAAGTLGASPDDTLVDSPATPAGPPDADANPAGADPPVAGDPAPAPVPQQGGGDASPPPPPAGPGRRKRAGGPDGGGSTAVGSSLRFVREVVLIVLVALVASALLRAFVVQAFFVPSGSMLPTIQLHDRILVSRIGDIDRGEVVVFEDPGNWIPSAEQAAPPNGVRKALEFVGVLPASGHEHLVKRVIGLPGDHVVCCEKGKLVINGEPVDESAFIKPGDKRADNVSFDVLVPKDSIFVLGDNRYVSGDSSRHPNGQEAFVPMDLVTGRAFAVIWPADHIQVLHIPDAYDDVPPGEDPPPDVGTFTQLDRGEQ